MREIKFRAKGDDKETQNRWFYGGYAKLDKTTYCFKEDYDRNPDNTVHYIIFDEMTDWGLPNRHLRASINRETLGQFTGLKDKNGVEIYEGDIVKINNDYEKYGINAGEIYQVYFKSGGYRLLPKYCKEALGYWLENGEDFVVIGNIYDNPELLKESD